MNRLPNWLRKNIPFIAFLLVAFAFRWSFADQYYIPSGSMEPTLHVGDRVLVNKMAYDFKIPYTSLQVARIGDPARGDIIVFENPKDGVTMVKRIIGLPKEHLVIDDGFVKIDGKPVEGTVKGEEEFGRADEPSFVYLERFGEKDATIQRLPFMSRPHHIEIDVPENSFFAMGDNRDNSSDSRVWGVVPRELLKGRAFAVFWSMKIENYIPHFDLSRTAQKVN